MASSVVPSGCQGGGGRHVVHVAMLGRAPEMRTRASTGGANRPLSGAA
jgi:hypothetical protein